MHIPFGIEANTMDMFIYAVLIINLNMKDDGLAKIKLFSTWSKKLLYLIKNQLF